MRLFSKKTYQEEIIDHYKKSWQNDYKTYLWDKGPFEKLPHDFRVLEFEPTKNRNMWTYATCAMSQREDYARIELHIFSSKRDEGLIELLTIIAHYHRNTSKLNVGHSVNFGRPWQDKSNCQYGLISLPYLDGPSLEDFQSSAGILKFYWLIPVTEEEVNFKAKYGIESLEQIFDERGLDYINSNRSSLV